MRSPHFSEKCPYTANWYPEYEENTRAANAEIQFLHSMKAALTVHNKNLRIKMEFLLKEKQQIAVLNNSKV